MAIKKFSLAVQLAAIGLLLLLCTETSLSDGHLFPSSKEEKSVLHKTRDKSNGEIFRQTTYRKKNDLISDQNEKPKTQSQETLQVEAHQVFYNDPHSVEWTSWRGIFYWIISLCLIGVSGIASGLTLGLLSVNTAELQLAAATAPKKKKKMLFQVIDLLTDRHLLLVTLLLTNSLALEALPIFLDRLFPSWAAILISVFAVLLFGEILPQALCTGCNQLVIAMKSVHLVRFLISLFFIISWPIAKALDHILGVTPSKKPITRSELSLLVSLNMPIVERKDSETIDYKSSFDPIEASVVAGALSLSSTLVKDVCVKLTSDVCINPQSMEKRKNIVNALYKLSNQVPVYNSTKRRVIGFFNPQALAQIIPNERTSLQNYITDENVLFISPFSNLCDALNIFRSHCTDIAFVYITDSPFLTNPCKLNAVTMNIATHFIHLKHIFKMLLESKLNQDILIAKVLSESSGKSTGLMTRVNGSPEYSWKESLAVPILYNKDKKECANDSTCLASRVIGTVQEFYSSFLRLWICLLCSTKQVYRKMSTYVYSKKTVRFKRSAETDRHEELKKPLMTQKMYDEDNIK